MNYFSYIFVRIVFGLKYFRFELECVVFELNKLFLSGFGFTCNKIFLFGSGKYQPFQNSNCQCNISIFTEFSFGVTVYPPHKSFSFRETNNLNRFFSIVIYQDYSQIHIHYFCQLFTFTSPLQKKKKVRKNTETESVNNRIFSLQCFLSERKKKTQLVCFLFT